MIQWLRWPEGNLIIVKRFHDILFPKPQANKNAIYFYCFCYPQEIISISAPAHIFCCHTRRFFLWPDVVYTWGVSDSHYIVCFSETHFVRVSFLFNFSGNILLFFYSRITLGKRSPIAILIFGGEPNSQWRNFSISKASLFLISFLSNILC